MTKKRGFMDGYKTRPGERGDVSQWRASFRQRMSTDEARAEVKDEKPWDILHVPHGTSWDDIRRAYRKACLQWHPDVCQDPRAELMMKKINAAYTLLEDEYGR